MDLILKRNSCRADGIFGELRNTLPDEVVCLTLEHSYQNDDYSFSPKVPCGTYICERGIHQLDHGGPFKTFEILNVPNHQGILFHVGNYNNDSNGCILVGSHLYMPAPNKQMLIQSELAFRKLMLLLAPYNSFNLIVKNT